MTDFRLRRHERITKRTDFQTVFKKGRRYSTKNFTIIVYQSNYELRRLGMAVSRKVGGAVKRNRVKRLLREFFRLHKKELPPGHDIVFVAKPGAARLDYFTLREEMLNFFGRMGPCS